MEYNVLKSALWCLLGHYGAIEILRLSGEDPPYRAISCLLRPHLLLSLSDLLLNFPAYQDLSSERQLFGNQVKPSGYIMFGFQRLVVWGTHHIIPNVMCEPNNKISAILNVSSGT